MKAPLILAPIADGLWHSEHDLFLPGGVHFRTRMVVMATGGDSRTPDLTLYGSVPMDAAHDAGLRALGNVTRIVAPNSFHHLYAGPAREQFAAAEFFITPALQKKRASLRGNVIQPGAEPRFGAVQGLVLGGMPKLDELVMFHGASGTLLVTDLVFNILEYKGWQAGVMFRLVGAHKKLAQSRMLKAVVRDRAAMASSLERLFSWDFDRVVMAHGDMVAQGGKDKLAALLRP
jgi:hypothetical protein